LDQASNRTFQEKLEYYRWPIGIVSFFLLLTVVNGRLAWIAFNNTQDQIESAPYEKGVQYQKVIDQLTYAKTLKVRADLTTGDFADGQREIQLTFSNTLESSLIENVQVKFYYPQTGKYDSSVLLTKLGPSTFVAKANLPLSGLCLVDILIETTEGKSALLKEKLWIG
jgi:nitrogen fixation protein FixH